ncbi:MAG: hypothetical protein M3268_03920, partial [Acidobacteriota bacterium]|nr:hypothetical protein [Acidobacteriota bacterium]
MNVARSLRRAAAPLLTPLLAVSLVVAQQPRATQPARAKTNAPPAQTKIATPAPSQTKGAPRESADAAGVTLDTLFGADSYAVYGEMRSVGQYMSSDEFKQLMGPLRLPGSMPSEMGELID